MLTVGALSKDAGAITEATQRVMIIAAKETIY